MNKLLLIVAIIIIVFISGGFIIFYNFKKESVYIIPNVPYYTFFNVGFNIEGKLVRSSSKAVLDMVYDYWNQEKNSLKTYPPNIDGRISIYTLAHFAAFQTNFDGFVLKARSIKDLHEFINPQERTPVIVIQKISLDYPGNRRDYRLIIGLDDKRKKVITHDFYFGNNYEIDYDEFEKLWEETSKYYLVIRPQDYKERLGSFKIDYNYPSRIPAMDQKKINIYFLLINEKRANIPLFTTPNNLKEIVEIFDNLLAEENNFQYFPKWFRSLIYIEAAERYLQAGQLNKAESLISKIIENNQNLKESFSGWQYQWPWYDELPSGWIVIGDIYKAKGNTNEALNYYNKALTSKNLLSKSHQEYLKKVINELSK